ncbi:hypothetical protein [Lentzea sp. HUAS12]|uniref:hypothetical protein n=1 Tax=Lentzea sp. HUAS12 TaxID=2951806 RepID=UPI00209F9F9D|nr:hypothetical protein [Lentzea sp. HUAS12]USX49476.1 hypothetical protein ND450_29100 [Lentzea sp. HUAS12]
MLETVARRYRQMMTWPIVGSYIVIIVLGVVGARYVNVDFVAHLAPNSKDALSVMWQVHAAVISVGFTGLAIAFQLLADPQLSPGPARRAVIRRIRFNQLLAVGISSDIATGMAAIWFQSHANVLLMFLFAFVPSVLAIGITYAYSAYLFGRPHEVEKLTIEDLVSTVQATAKQLAGYNEKARALAESASLLSNVVLESPGSDKAKSVMSVRLAGPPQGGVVQDVDLKKIEQISVLLSSTISLEKMEAEADDPIEFVEADGPIAFIKAQPGSNASAGASIVDVYGIDKVPLRARNQLQKLAVSAVLVSSSVDDPAELLLRALEDLQEVLMSAMQAARYPSIKRGFKHYRRIVLAVREVMEESGDLTTSSYETNWRWLSTHVWELNDVAARVGDRVAMEATGAIYGRCVDALSSTDIGFFVAQAQNYFQIWSVLLLKAKENENALEHLLVSLQNLTEYTVPYSGNHNRQHVDRLAGAALEVWTTILRDAYDKGESVWATRALGFQSRLFRFASESVKMRSRVHQSSILVIAWLLYRQEILEDDTGAEVGEVLASIQPDFMYPNSVLLAAVEARREDSYELIRRWEMSTSLPLEMRVVRAGDFVLRAGLLLLAKFPPLAPGSVPREVYDFSLAANQQVGPLRESFDIRWGISKDTLSNVDMILGLLIERYQGESQQQLKIAALDDERIAKFTEAVSAEVQKVSNLVRFIDAEQVIHDPANSRVWGHRLTVAKLFFVETEVLGDPGFLGQQVGRMIRANEEALALTQLLAWGTSTSLSFARTVQKISKWVATASDPLVVIFGSYEAASMLNFNHEGSSVTVGGATVAAMQLLVHDDIEEHIALLDRTKIPRLARFPEVGGVLKPIDGDRISLSVVDKGEVDSDGAPAVEIEFGSSIQTIHPSDIVVDFIRIDDLPAD